MTKALGVTYDRENKNIVFRLYSKNATKALLCIFNTPKGENPVMTLNMEKEGDIFETKIKDYVFNGVDKPIFYGYRLFGPNWEYREDYQPNTDIGFISKFDPRGNRFNPNKIAYDPYCLELSHLPSDVDAAYNLFRSGGEFHLKDNAKWAPKSVFYPHKGANPIKIAPRPFADEIIAEVHIKDLTYLLNMPERATYKGAGEFAKTIKDLGITMIEFLPLNEFDHRQNGYNYWGYMPLGYFTLARKYAYNKGYGCLFPEFQNMINEFHKNGIKVCLDMVYNHTGEGGLVNNNPQDANLLSYALIDNSQYYKVYEDGYYRSNSGCGNDFFVSNKPAEDIVVESLAFFANQGVDAFRFDLGAALLECSDTCQEIYDSINSLAATLKDKLREKNINIIDDFTQAQEGIVLIAEPWTCCAQKCYHLGSFPDFWAEWNDISRDTIRKLTLKSDEITPKNLREVFEGTPSKFSVNKSINYIACHDGFTLYDLNSYNQKSPSTQGGSSWEISGSYNGDYRKREKAIRQQLAFLFLSKGIPMIQAGDIIMHTKSGNNNSYNKDDKTNYLDWKKATAPNTIESRICEYVRNLIHFRKNTPAFSDSDFVSKLTYHYDNADYARIDNKGYWDNVNDDFFGVLIDGENRLYIALSKSDNNMEITLPIANSGKIWRKCLDTSDLSNIELSPKEAINSKYILEAHSSAIFTEQ